MGRLRPAATTPPGSDICTIPAGGRQCSRARTPDLEGAPCLHARVARFYGGAFTPAGSDAAVTPRWRRCTGHIFRGIPLKELTSEGPARHSHRRRCKYFVTPLRCTTHRAVSARCGAGSRSGSPPPAHWHEGQNRVKSRAGPPRSMTGFWRSPPRRAGQYRARDTHRRRAPHMGGGGRGESPV